MDVDGRPGMKPSSAEFTPMTYKMAMRTALDEVLRQQTRERHVWPDREWSLTNLKNHARWHALQTWSPELADRGAYAEDWLTAASGYFGKSRDEVSRKCGTNLKAFAKDVRNMFAFSRYGKAIFYHNSVFFGLLERFGAKEIESEFKYPGERPHRCDVCSSCRIVGWPDPAEMNGWMCKDCYVAIFGTFPWTWEAYEQHSVRVRKFVSDEPGFCPGCSSDARLGREHPADGCWYCYQCFVNFYGGFPWTEEGIRLLSQRKRLSSKGGAPFKPVKRKKRDEPPTEATESLGVCPSDPL
eukprot:TRINITY_DN69073_c0_g1_i1.p1 TRINITY_DN69073_c0_g1~~TRINITY_DN69073_c0_g1_i1.p1  ORF type:complete len:320 (-),score=27.96 TRINITY_DN69073_c0_g1_i1:260-1150(-)